MIIIEIEIFLINNDICNMIIINKVSNLIMLLSLLIIILSIIVVMIVIVLKIRTMTYNNRVQNI